jgi:hypothetical protein
MQLDTTMYRVEMFITQRALWGATGVFGFMRQLI